MRKKHSRRLAVLVFLLFSGSTPAASLLQQVRGKIIASQPFKADFVQQVYIDGEMNLEESGFIVFANRGQVKWQYLRPDYKTFILENKRYQFYDRENNQLLQGPIGMKNEQLIWDLLFAETPGQINHYEEKGQTIRLSLDAAEGLQRLVIKLGRDSLPERVEQTSDSGVTTIYLFRNYLKRIEPAANEFVLRLPPGVEIIEE